MLLTTLEILKLQLTRLDVYKRQRLHGLILFGGITMKKPIFTGAGVAIITPFTSDGKVNYTALKDILEYLPRAVLPLV